MDASAAVTMSPNPVTTAPTLVNVQSGDATGTLTASPNARVDIVVSGSCSGGGQGTFAVSPNNNVNLNSDEVITVSYTPSASGPRTCRVDVFDDNTTTVLGTFSVSGTGEDPAAMAVSYTTADFGSTRHNNAAAVHTTTRNFTVTNTGDQTLTVSSVTVGGDFAVTAGGTSNIMIAGGAARVFTVTFDPSAAGTRTSTLTFNSTAPSTPTLAIPITGVGTNAVIGVTAPMGGFGTVNTGSSALLDITVRNTAMTNIGPLGVQSATISDPNSSGWFAFTGSCSGQNCTFSPALSITTMTTVGIRCSPPTMALANEMQTATISFNSDTDNATA
ncbi:MAG TPA: choice-of-anchor D domain-containing protein, partial [Kofleriaceae bacterium]